MEGGNAFLVGKRGWMWMVGVGLEIACFFIYMADIYSIDYKVHFIRTT